MCGISGIIGDYRSEELDNMVQVLKHRGPDFTGKYFDEGYAALGHNRLSIIDLSAKANQPFLDISERYVLVFNGEIYNYIELRTDLEKHYSFKTDSDTEVLLAAFIFYGVNCLSKLNGMFSFAIWDKHDKKLFAARDRFGVKPFYYSLTKKTFRFSSEIKGIHASGVNKKPNEKVWASYFVYGSYGDLNETFWEDVLQLPGGHFLEYTNEKLTISRWYCFEDEVLKQPKNLTYAQAKENYLLLLKDSISLRFRSDVEVGFNISGGLDSSVLLSLVNDTSLFKHNENIKAYTFYTNDSNYDELPWVEKMIEKTNNPLSKVLLKADEVEALSNKITFHQDEPFGGIPTLAYSKIFEQARKENVLVLLDGQGMDEQWAGYDYYTQSNDAIIQGVQESPYKIKMLSDDFVKKAVRPNFPKPFEDEILNKQYRDLFYTKIPRALRFNDRVSMAFSTELREPFLDYRLVEFAFSLPLAFKINNGVTKFMLREIAAEYFSSDIAFAPKRALQTPQREWLFDDLKVWVQTVFSNIAQANVSSWFELENLKEELKVYQNGNIKSSFHIWQCISLLSYINDNID